MVDADAYDAVSSTDTPVALNTMTSEVCALARMA